MWLLGIRFWTFAPNQLNGSSQSAFERISASTSMVKAAMLWSAPVRKLQSGKQPLSVWRRNGVLSKLQKWLLLLAEFWAMYKCCYITYWGLGIQHVVWHALSNLRIVHCWHLISTKVMYVLRVDWSRNHPVLWPSVLQAVLLARLLCGHWLLYSLHRHTWDACSEMCHGGL